MIKYRENLFFNLWRVVRHANIALSIRLKNWKKPRGVTDRFDALGHLRMHARDVNVKLRNKMQISGCAAHDSSSRQHDIYHAARKGRDRCRIKPSRSFFSPFFSSPSALHIVPCRASGSHIDRLINLSTTSSAPRLFYLSLESPWARTHARLID